MVKRLGILTGGGDCGGVNAMIEAAVKSATNEEWIVDGLLPRVGTSILAGKPKCGKSTMVRNIVSTVSEGVPSDILTSGLLI